MFQVALLFFFQYIQLILYFILFVGYKSAIKDYLVDENVVLSTEASNAMRTFIGGFKRKIAFLKQNGEMSATEGIYILHVYAFNS